MISRIDSDTDMLVADGCRLDSRVKIPLRAACMRGAERKRHHVAIVVAGQDRYWRRYSSAGRIQSWADAGIWQVTLFVAGIQTAEAYLFSPMRWWNRRLLMDFDFLEPEAN
jgi:hypothetical protein